MKIEINTRYNIGDTAWTWLNGKPTKVTITSLLFVSHDFNMCKTKAYYMVCNYGNKEDLSGLASFVHTFRVEEDELYKTPTDLIKNK